MTLLSGPSIHPKKSYISAMRTVRFLALPAILALTGCGEAPRDNPLDPLSPQYRGVVAVGGTVALRSIGTPVANAQLTSLTDGISTNSDASGRYSFPRLSSGQQTIVCSKANFVPDTARLTLASGSTQEVPFFLNGAPVVVSQTIVTRKIDQYFPSAEYYVVVSASVTDPNGVADLDSVWFAADTLVFAMAYDIPSKLFTATIYMYSFPTNTIQWLVGRPLHIISRDLLRAVNTSDGFYVTRVIENGATPTYPTALNNDTTGSTPLLQWTQPSVTFNHSYTLNISRVDAGTKTSIWTRTGIDSFNDQWQFPGDGSGQTLPSADYIWTVAVVDEFGNTCRSKEAAFVVR
jgi:hypothetical protein